MIDTDKDGQTGGQKDQDDKNTANNSGQEDNDGDQGGDLKFSPAQQAHINSLLAEERRKESRKAASYKKELEVLKSKKGEGGDSSKDNTRISDLEGRLAKYEAKELADQVCADLKIPKEEREKYIRHVTATDEDGIRDQIKALKQDFAPKRTGMGSNPAKQGKPGKNDSINQYIRNRGRIGR